MEVKEQTRGADGVAAACGRFEGIGAAGSRTEQIEQQAKKDAPNIVPCELPPLKFDANGVVADFDMKTRTTGLKIGIKVEAQGRCASRCVKKGAIGVVTTMNQDEIWVQWEKESNVDGGSFDTPVSMTLGMLRVVEAAPLAPKPKTPHDPL